MSWNAAAATAMRGAVPGGRSGVRGVRMAMLIYIHPAGFSDADGTLDSEKKLDPFSERNGVLDWAWPRRLAMGRILVYSRVG